MSDFKKIITGEDVKTVILHQDKMAELCDKLYVYAVFREALDDSCLRLTVSQLREIRDIIQSASRLEGDYE